MTPNRRKELEKEASNLKTAEEIAHFLQEETSLPYDVCYVWAQFILQEV